MSLASQKKPKNQYHQDSSQTFNQWPFFVFLFDFIELFFIINNMTRYDYIWLQLNNVSVIRKLDGF